MNKISFIKLAALSTIILVALVFFISPNESDNSNVVNVDENTASANETELAAYADNNTRKNIEKTTAINQAENLNDQPDEQASEIKQVEKSKFKQRCLDVLSNVTESINTDYISAQDQAKVSNVFNNCIYEIEAELALTERQFTRSTETMPCFNSLYEIRDYLLELGTKAQRFSELPNNKDSDNAAITEAFFNISDDIIVNGASAMMNRSIACSMDLRE